MEEEAKPLFEDLENLLAHADDEQTVTKLRSRLSDEKFRTVMFKSMGQDTFRNFVITHEPLSDYVDVLSCILEFMCECTEEYSSESEITKKKKRFWDSVNRLSHHFMASPELFELLWTKLPSISLENEFSALLLAMSPVLRDCHVTCGDISPHPFITFQANTLAHQVFSVLTSNRLEPMRSKAVCCAVFLLFSRCSEPNHASDFEFFFKTQTGLEAEDMDTLCRTTIHPSFLQLPCFTATNLGNDDLTFVGCASRLLEYHQQISKSAVLNEREGDATELQNVDSSMMLSIFELNILLVCTLLSLPSSTFDSITPDHPTEDASHKEDADENSTEEEEEEEVEELNQLRTLLVNTFSLLLDFRFWEALGNVNTPDFCLQIESSALLLSHPTLLPLLPLVNNNLSVVTWSDEDEGGYCKNITPSMLVSFVRGMCHEGTDISDELAASIAKIMHKVFFGFWYSPNDQEHGPQNRQLFPTVQYFVKELNEVKDEPSQRRIVVCLWALGTASNGKQFCGTGASISLAEILSSGVDDRLALFILRFFASALTLRDFPWSERQDDVFVTAVPHILTYTQRVDFPLLSKLAWDAIHLLVKRHRPDNCHDKASDQANALFNDVVRILPQSIELFVDSLRTASGDDALAKKAVLVGITAAINTFAENGKRPIFTPLIISLHTLLTTFQVDIINTHYLDIFDFYSCSDMAFSITDDSLCFSFLQISPSSPHPDDVLSTLTLSILDDLLHGTCPQECPHFNINWHTFDSIGHQAQVYVLFRLFAHLLSAFCDNGERFCDPNDIWCVGLNLITFLDNRVVPLQHFPLAQMLFREMIESIQHRVMRHSDHTGKRHKYRSVDLGDDFHQAIDFLFQPTTPHTLVLPLFALRTVLLLEHNPRIDLSTVKRVRFIPPGRPPPPIRLISTPNRALLPLTNTVDEWTRLLVEEGLEDVVVFLTSEMMVPMSQVMGMNIFADSRARHAQEVERLRQEQTENNNISRGYWFL
ncbi:hypothetical protein BLNAU_10023 [Blattamonas nauphoetae]|uniref:Uncharacterized protein n=1 Tax=Blattamonas nauphoetae TaxID=2049346 RepID=A0ABQ9XUE2_9EUKA|nr:hypothetical protein BLNAU_10023 [Blattamonas nauphoetae]